MAKIMLAGTPLPAQLKFLQSRARFPAMFGGYGSGKTHGLVYKMFQLMDANPGLPGGIVCPDKVMFGRDVYPLICQVCADSNVTFTYKQSKGELYFPTTKSTVYIFHGEARGRNIRGPNLAWMLLNEMTLLDVETFEAAVGRVRLKSAPFSQIAGSGTPEDFNWAYDRFIDKPMEDSEVVYADSRQNPHTAQGYVQMLVSSYDEITTQQYVEGKFVPRGGQRAIYQFDRRIHRVEEVPDCPGEDWVHVDFNVYPMAATIYRHTPSLPTKLWGVAEVNLHGADTEQLCDVLAEKLGEGWQEARIYPDAIGGRQRHSSSVGLRTDLQIMATFGFKNIHYETRYSVRDQLNAVNAFIAKGHIKWHSSCEETIRDLERVRLKVGGHDLDKTDPMRTHWLDGLKNMLHVEFPVVRSYSEFTSQRIR